MSIELIVIAAIIEQSGQFLIAQRPINDSLSNKWEFPGGKLEKGETPEECLKRELMEEFDIECEIGKFYCESIYPYPDRTVKLLSYKVANIKGTLRLNEHQAIAWVKPIEFKNYDFAEADTPIVAKIKQEHLVC